MALATFALALAMGISILPTTFTSLLLGYTLGYTALTLMVPAYLIATVIGYTLGRYFRPPALLQYLASLPGGANLMARLSASTWKTVAWLRLSPVVPFGLGNLAMAWANISIPNVLTGSLLGMLPRTSLAIAAGKGAGSLLAAIRGGNPLPWAPYAVLAIVAASSWYLYLLYSQAQKGKNT
jgi:uncharacterized membrane protein YdjX (TVP38/TMEM64 family)